MLLNKILKVFLTKSIDRIYGLISQLTKLKHISGMMLNSFLYYDQSVSKIKIK